MKGKKRFRKTVAAMSVLAVGMTGFTPAMPAAAAQIEVNTVVSKANTELTKEKVEENDYVLYTVNCGTSDPSVVPNQKSERMGLLQSNVDQEYGADQTTGKVWGRNPADEYSRAVNHAENASDIGYSYIYMDKDVQYDKYKSALGYSFEVPQTSIDGLEENTYEVTVAFKHYWDNRAVNIMLEDRTVASDVSVNYGEWVSRTFTVKVTDGELNLLVKSPRRTSSKQDPLLNFVKVRAVPEEEKVIPSYSSFTGVAGETMYDTNGNVIQAHGGQIQQLTVDGVTKWYWIGEDKTNDYRPCGGIRMYSSDDLYNWTDEGSVLKTMENPEQFETDSYFKELYGAESQEQKDAVFVDLDKNNCVMERPKMLYNEKNDNYVIWFHADGRYPGSDADYGKAKAGVAVSDSPTGPFKLLGSYKLNHAGNNYGYDGEAAKGSVRDINLFKDDDGTAYVIYSSEGNETMYVSKLNEDYTWLSAEPKDAVEGVDFTRNFAKWSREAPAMFQYKDKYYVVTSGCTGWSPNQAKYAVADHPMGPWTEIGDPCTDWGSGTTYDTQSTCIFPVDAKKGKYIYMGDRWNAGDLSESRYVWIPVEFQEEDKIALRRYENWTLEDLTGKEEESQTDKESLRLAVTMAEKLEQEQKANNCFTKDSWSRVQAALDAGKALLDNTEVSQKEIDQALLDLITACNLLENGVQKVGLKAAIEGTKAILEDSTGLEEYTKESVDNLRAALADAEKVFAEESADQETVNMASARLMDAVTMLLIKGEDTRLTLLIKKAEEILKNKDQYTPSTIANLETALESAKETAGNTQATQQQINEVYSKLAEAMASLVRKAHKSELKNALDKAKEIMQNAHKYLEETIQGLKNAADAAQDIYDNDEADSATVGEALKNLIAEILKARLLGDVDFNGVVDSSDSTEVLKYTAESKTLSKEQTSAADVNRDGIADSSDAASILQYAAEKITEF